MPISNKAVYGGVIGAIVMIPFALLFSAMGLRIYEYGKKVIQVLFCDFSALIPFALCVINRFVLS